MGGVAGGDGWWAAMGGGKWVAGERWKAGGENFHLCLRKDLGCCGEKMFSESTCGSMKVTPCKSAPGGRG